MVAMGRCGIMDCNGITHHSSKSLGESKGISGEFDIVLSLVSLQDCGNSEKDLVNMVVDH